MPVAGGTVRADNDTQGTEYRQAYESGTSAAGLIDTIRKGSASLNPATSWAQFKNNRLALMNVLPNALGGPEHVRGELTALSGDAMPPWWATQGMRDQILDSLGVSIQNNLDARAKTLMHSGGRVGVPAPQVFGARNRERVQ